MKRTRSTKVRIATNTRTGRRVAFQQIIDDKQYGLSYEINTAPSKRDDSLSLGSLKGPGGSERSQKKLFFKVPIAHEFASDEALKAEIAREISIKHALNRASDLLKGRASGGRFRFQIPKMLGAGVLTDTQSGECASGILFEFGNGKNLAKDDFTALADSIRSSGELLEFLMAFAESVQLFHNQNLAHSFIVPRNLILSPERDYSTVKIVGFGYARLGYGNLRPRPTFKASDEDKLFLAPECKNLKSYGPLWFPADIYSIGAIAFGILCRKGAGADQNLYRSMVSTVLGDPQRDVARLKRLLKESFYDPRVGDAMDIVEDNENIIKIIDHCLRFDPEERFSCIEELIEMISIASPVRPEKTRQASSDRKSMIFQKTSRNVFFDGIAHERIAFCEGELDKIRNGHIEIFGNRDRIIRSLCRIIGLAGEGDEYCTMTIPHYWLDQNLGPLGRFLTMNKHRVRKGLTIRRLFLVDDPNFHLLEADEQQMLIDHLEAVDDVADSYARGRSKGKFDVKVRVVDPEAINRFERDGRTVGFLKRHSNGNSSGPEDVLCLNFFSSTSSEWYYGKEYVNRHIRKVGYWNPGEPSGDSWNAYSQSSDFFEAEWNEAISLRDYISQGHSLRNLVSGLSSARDTISPKEITFDLILNRQSGI